MNNLCLGCRISREDYLDPNAVCNHEGAKEHTLPERTEYYKKILREQEAADGKD